MSASSSQIVSTGNEHKVAPPMKIVFGAREEDSEMLTVQQVPLSQDVFTVYFAGKVRQPGNDYRCHLFHDDVMLEGNHMKQVLDLCGTKILYGGPTCINRPLDYFRTTHGNATDICAYKDGKPGDPMELLVDERAVVDRCLSQIVQCDFVFAYLEDLTCYGTLAEIGYASGIGKPVFLSTSSWAADMATAHANTPFAWGSHGTRRSELWFVETLPNVRPWGASPSDFFEIVRRKVWMKR